MPKRDGTGPPRGGRKQDGSGGGKGRRTNKRGIGSEKGGKKGKK